MTCEQYQQLAAFARSAGTELPPEDLRRLADHEQSCLLCAAQARREQTWDRSFARAMRSLAPPKGIRDRILARLARDRRAWWLRFSGSAALALAIPTALWFAVSFYSRPIIDPLTVVQAAYEQSGLWRSSEEVRDSATQWLRTLDPRLEAPDEWNYKWLAYFDRADFQGLRSVPVLVFTRGDATLRLFAIRQSAVRQLERLVDQPIEEGGCTFLARSYPQYPGWIFVAVTSGATPEAFRLSRTPVRPI